ncbi:MAG: orotate phosphoribosyltransferase [Spirochaetota bacterium]|nr:MAG: orotate phosphoribosyltransferase [Spirochaetota bacterium]
MDHARAITLLKSSGALLEGHFLLSSGNHSEQYIQCAALLARPDLALEFMEDIAQHYKGEAVDAVVSPAVGGIIVSYEVARLLGKRALFLEREDGKMTLRRGFKINKGDNVIIVEDVITTGGSVFEVQDTVEKSGGLVRAFASIVNRSAGRFTPGVPYYSCIEMDIPIFKPEMCPLCKSGTPLVKPGSRNLK